MMQVAALHIRIIRVVILQQQVEIAVLRRRAETSGHAVADPDEDESVRGPCLLERVDRDGWPRRAHTDRVLESPDEEIPGGKKRDAQNERCPPPNRVPA